MAEAGSITRYDAGSYVFHEGEQRPARLSVLLSGRLQMSKLASSGKETIMRLIHPGEMFGSLGLFGETTLPASALVVEDAKVFTMERDRLLEVIRESPELALSLLQALSDRLRETQNRLHAMASERAPNRLAQVLVQQARREGTPEGQELQEKLSYKMLAQMCGITYEETVRIMRGWIEAGILSYHRGGSIAMLNLARLDEIATGQAG